jgi:quercetin dioxygenase-like cupin family protein
MKIDEKVFIETIQSMDFEDKQTADNEFYGVNRIQTSQGGVEFVKLYKDMSYKAHIHDKASAIFIFLTGTGNLLLDGKAFPYAPGKQFDVPAGVLHGFELAEETIFLSIQSHPIQDRETGEIDIRYE